MAWYTSYESGCYKSDCNGQVCLTPEQHQEAWEKGTSFFCSRGHSQVFAKTVHLTYDDMEALVKKLERERKNLLLQIDGLKGARDRFSARLRDAVTCPFPECHRAGYEYASQRTFLAHLDRFHATDIEARLIEAWEEHETLVELREDVA